jgi:hypothetical protein
MLGYLCNFPKNVTILQLPKSRKFVQSGHTVWKSTFWLGGNLAVDIIRQHRKGGFTACRHFFANVITVMGNNGEKRVLQKRQQTRQKEESEKSAEPFFSEKL